MSNPWCRLYSEFADDPKVQMMSESDQRRLVMLFCERCKDVKHNETLRAFHWRITPLELNATKAIFLENGFIDEDWNVLNWNRRQYLSDSSTERVRQYRDRKKHNETLQFDDVTPPDTDTEAESKGKEPSGDKPPKEPTKSDLIKQRHADCKAKLKLYWEYRNPGVEMPWGPAEGKQLAMWMQQSPLTTVDQFAEFLRNRAKSEVNHAERPSRWIANVTSYANGPLNSFRQPLNGGGKSNGKIERSVDVAAKLVAEFENNNSVVERELLSGG